MVCGAIMDVGWGEEDNVLNRWDALPEECKSMILSRLSTKEVARIARVSKEFLKAVNVLRSSVHLLVLPPTLAVPALEGMVAAHTNLKSLSFKRCGLKLKTFVSIIRAAAGGHLCPAENLCKLDLAGSEKKKLRSLESVDFRNCLHLLDTDVSMLCNLHSRLEEVDLTGCPCLSDTALLTLARYQHVERPSDPLEKFKCYPRFTTNPPSHVNSDDFTETEEQFLKNNDAAVFEEIQGLALHGSSHFRSWPKLGSSSDRFGKESVGSGRRVEEGKVGGSPYAPREQKKHDMTSTGATVLRKSYAQMASKSGQAKAAPPLSTSVGSEKINSGPQTSLSVKPAEPCSTSSFAGMNSAVPLSSESNKPADMDPTLTYIDWSLSDANGSCSSLISRSRMESNIELPSSSTPTGIPETSLIPYESSGSEIAASNRYHNMYKQYLVNEVESSSTALPALKDKLCITPVQSKIPTKVQSGPMFAQIDERGSRYSSEQISISDDRMTRTQTSVFFPKFQDEDKKSSDVMKQPMCVKSMCVAGATEIRDERVDLSKRVNAGASNRSAEALCRTTNHVAVFAVSEGSLAGRLEAVDLKKMSEIPAKYIHPGNSGHLKLGEVDNPSQLAICLPGAMHMGGKYKRYMQPGPSSADEENCGGTNFSYYEKRQSSGASFEEETSGASFHGSVKGLRAVHVAGCPEITDRGVQALLKGASRTCLCTLDVSRCIGITNAGIRLPARSGLQHLIAVQMPGINRLVYQLPVQSLLQHLNLAACYKLEELVLVASSLKTLNLSNCKRLTRLHLKCSSLASLNLSLCDSLERFIKFQCGALQNLNFLGCRMLAQSALNAAVEVASNLEELRCGGCDRIERLDLLQPNLFSLEVSGCQSLRRVFCQSRVLRVVDACGCKGLTEVYLYSPYLRRMLFSNCALLQILVIPLDAIKETMDAAAAQNWRKNGTIMQEELEIAISGCNMPDGVKKNLGKLTKQWQSCFKSQ